MEVILKGKIIDDRAAYLAGIFKKKDMYKIKDIAKILNVSDRTVEKSIESHNRQMELILLSITNKNLLRSKSSRFLEKVFSAAQKLFLK